MSATFRSSQGALLDLSSRMLHRLWFGNKQVSVAGWCGLLTFCILLLAWVLGFSIRLFSVIRFESVIHEFDPWFNYRATKQMVESNFQLFYNWFDSTAWYPLGRIVGGTVYPGLMVTSGMLNSPSHNMLCRIAAFFLALVEHTHSYPGSVCFLGPYIQWDDSSNNLFLH